MLELLWKWMKMSFAIWLMLTCLRGTAHSQNTHYIDSLEAAVISTSDEATKIDLLDKIFDFYIKKNYEKAQVVAERIVEIADLSKNKGWLAIAYTNKGELHRKKFEYTRSLEYLNKAYELYTSLRDEIGQAQVLNKIGNTYFSLDDHTKALNYYQEVLKISEKIGDTERTAYAYMNIGLLNIQFGEEINALSSLKVAVELFEKANNRHALAIVTSRLGTIYHVLEKYDSALLHYDNALLIFKQFDDPDEIALIYTNIAHVHLQTHRVNEAKKYIAVAIDQNTRLDNKSRLSQNYVLKGDIFKKEQKYSSAIKNYLRAQSLASEIGDLETLRGSNEELAIIYEKQGLLQQSIEHYKKFLIFNDSVYNEKKTREFARLKKNYEINRRQLEIENLKKSEELKNVELSEKQQAIEFRNNLLVIVIVSMILVLTSIFLYLRKRNQLEMISKSLLGIKHEKNQLLGIVAHDLKNTLNNIHSIIQIFRKNTSNLHKKQLNYLSAMQQNAQRLKLTINNILSINKFEDRVANFTRTRVDSTIILKEVLESSIFSAVDKQIEFNTDGIETDCPVIGDEQFIREIFDNLVSNAIKYSPHNRNIELKLYKVSDKVYFTIYNETQNITFTSLDQLLSKYSMARNIPTGGETSTGLGLSIVKEYLKAMDGEIQFDGQSGFRFTFYLPAYQDENGDQAISSASADSMLS